MRRGSRWRVGWCQIFNSEGTLHLGTRARIEKADEAWILGVNPDRKEASVDESILAAKYGLVTATFRNTHLEEPQQDRIWESLDNGEQRERAMHCLEDHGRDIAHPIWKRGTGAPRVIARVHEMRACNLLPGLMSVPSHDGGKENHWEMIADVRSNDFQGEVCSLRVEPHETYVADGIITHNCIYTWRGADPSAFTASDIPEENQSVLAQSYRVPVAVHAHAVRWIEGIAGRDPVEYRPRDHEGEVRQIEANWQNPGRAVGDALRYIANGKTVMFLTSCSYMLQELVRNLREEGIPFHNQYRRRNGAWNPLQKRRGTVSTADRVAAFMRLSENGFWTAQDMNDWTQMTKIKGVLNANGRKNVKTLQDSPDGGLEWSDILSVLTNEAVDQALRGNLEWFDENLTSAKKVPARYPLAIARNRGIEELTSVPRLTIGTIHCSPGDEPVFTTNGWVRMEDLDPTRHRLPGYHRNTNQMTWGGTNNPVTDNPSRTTPSRTTPSRTGSTSRYRTGTTEATSWSSRPRRAGPGLPPTTGCPSHSMTTSTKSGAATSCAGATGGG